MGKAQYKKRIRSARQQANGAPFAPDDSTSASGPTENTLETSSKRPSKKSKTQPKDRETTVAVLDKITSDSSTDRLWSLAAVSNLVLSSASTRRLLLSKNLVALLITRLKEDEDHEEILVEATGVLRNLVIEGGKEVCGEMANKGILLPMSSLIAKVLASFAQFQKVAGDGTNGVKNATEHALNWARLTLLCENLITIFWSLAEASNKQLDSVSKTRELVPLLLNILSLFTEQILIGHPVKSKSSHYAIPSSLALASAQCLYTLTEDNAKLANQLVSDEVQIKPLIALFTAPDKAQKEFTDEENEDVELLKVVATGILRNFLSLVKRPERLSFKSTYDEKMAQQLAAKLQVDLGELASEAAQANATVPSIPLSDLNIAKASVQAPSSSELTLESIERRLTIVQLSLELVGEWCATADGFEAENEGSSADEDEGETEVDETEGVEEGDSDRMEDEDGPVQSGDVDMEDISQGDGQIISKIKPEYMDQDPQPPEDHLNGMDTEETGIEPKFTHSNLFAKLLERFNSLAQPTPYLYQSNEVIGSGPRNTIPAAATSFAPDASLGTLPALVNDLLGGIHIRAIDSLNNMIITLDRLESAAAPFVDQFVSNNQSALQSAWVSCFSLARDLVKVLAKGKEREHSSSSGQQKSARDQLLLSVTTCMWTLSRVLLANPRRPQMAAYIAPDQSKCLMEMLKAIDDQQVKIRLVSTLTHLGSRHDVSVVENEAIGGLLMDIISNSNVSGSDIPNALLIAALDGLFDMYADETREYDEPVFRQRQFLDVLVAAVSTINSVVKKIDKRKDSVLRQQAEDAQANLSAFIKYRQSLL